MGGSFYRYLCFDALVCLFLIPSHQVPAESVSLLSSSPIGHSSGTDTPFMSIPTFITKLGGQYLDLTLLQGHTNTNCHVTICCVKDICCNILLDLLFISLDNKNRCILYQIHCGLSLNNSNYYPILHNLYCKSFIDHFLQQLCYCNHVCQLKQRKMIWYQLS